MDNPGFSESKLSGEANPMLPGETAPDTPDASPTGDCEATVPAAVADPSVIPPVVPGVASSLPRNLRHTARNLLVQMQFALLAIIIALFIITFVVQAFRIPSGSMENTLLVGDYLLVDKTRFGPSGPWSSILPYRAIHRGDIIVFRYPVDPSQHFVKRVIGLPGDRIRLWHSRVYINGRALHEPYVVFKQHFPDEFRDNFPLGNRGNENINMAWAARLRFLVDHGEIIVPSGQYFALGDNRDQSLDSRYWGFVPRENIIGRPIVIYFSIVGAEQDDDPVATGAANDKLFTLGARISHVLDDLRWRRILRLAP
jgi:signal peptidase I